MNKKLKRLLACLMCVCSVGGIMTGCGEDKIDSLGESDYGTVALPNYNYANVAQDGNYNRNLFYRNDLEVKYGDPTTIYVDEGEWAGTFFTSGTSTGKSYNISMSKNFVDWELAGDGYTPAKNHFGYDCFWAPQLMYDKDARWGDYNKGEEGEEDKKGLFFMYYCAKTSPEYVGSLKKSTNYLAVAIATQPGGPYTEYVGTNLNGTRMDASVPLFNIEYINPANPDALCTTLDDNAVSGWELYREGRSFIDPAPFIDPVTGDKYMFFCRNRCADTTNEIWGVKMKDWVTPDYTTVTRITAFGFLTVEGAETSDRNQVYDVKGYTLKIDEGPFAYYKDGTYYMTFSIGSTNDKLYPVGQALATSPLGPYTKVQGADGGIVCSPGSDWDMNSSGHHSFVEVGDELWIVYHSYPVSSSGSIGNRGQGFDRVFLHANENGKMVLHANGPTKTIQPLPEVVSGYKNIAPLATVTAAGAAEGSDAKWLNDNLILMHEGDSFLNDQIPEFEVEGDHTVITLDFNDYVTARAIMVYNASNFMYTFTGVEKIEMMFRDKDGKTGIATIDNLGFCVDANIVPLDFIYSPDELEDIDETYYTIRSGGAAIAEFNEISVNKIRFTIKKGEKRDGLKVNEIVVLGKTA